MLLRNKAIQEKLDTEDIESSEINIINRPMITFKPKAMM